MEITDKTIEALLRALDLSVEGITVHHSFYRNDARDAAATIRALRAELAQACAAITSEPRSVPHREAS